MNKKLLERPTIYTERREDHFIGARPSLTYCMWGLLQYTELRGISLDEVNGLTGHAFYLNIFEDSIHIAGPTTFAGEPYTQEALSNLGYNLDFLPFANVEPAVVEQAHQIIKASIDRGLPVIAWDLFHPEFGMIYGYDDDNQVYHVIDKLQENTLPYNQLGHSQTAEIYVIALLERNEISKQQAVHNMLSFAVKHGYTNGSLDHPIGPIAQGLAAYDAWINAFKNRSLHPFFNAYNIIVYCELRAYAAAFLHRLSEDDTIHERKILKQASVHYDSVSKKLYSLSELFPFPQCGDPHNSELALQGIQILSQAKEEETQGLSLLKQLLDTMNIKKLEVKN
ncbi:BtrH N-terminal domain-containing protein [Paenibacillus sp. L3-i20]|uniref:BtrH N-terminal domain-containing protein n=1 Tax=Paenibacillus sp. L3-i20 TaxID=2905833 RepID=UPI001EDD6950|nr:BtrH N-terminal domain-containing protein [Paenibacillus sp. L3-i20]GKU75886.1 hypothetical protein L3i20_v202830 [Paenibacillus sp. L3-i20]